MKTVEQKYQTIINKNTFYFFDEEFEREYEKHIFALKETIIHLKNVVKSKGCTKEVFEQFLESKKELGLKALLAITGFSNESFKRLITVIRIVDTHEVNEFTFRKHWDDTETAESEGNRNISEWGTQKIEKLVNENPFFRKGLVNIFYEGSTINFFRNTLPSFEFHKLSVEKLEFDIHAIIDTLARYKEKGSRAGKPQNNPEILIKMILQKHGISFEKGDLHELLKTAPDQKRTMDFIIPSKQHPLIIIESSFVMTTSSNQGDKSKAEIAVDSLLKQIYRDAVFIGFVDGIGWYVRKGDLKRMVTAYEDVFTYHEDELQRFEHFLLEKLNHA